MASKTSSPPGLITLLAVLVFILGCSGGVNPTSPDPDLSDRVQTSSAPGNTHLWGIWDVSLDPNTGTAEIVPVRGLEFTANVTQFLQPPIATHHLMGIDISSETEWETGYVKVDVIFTHPFPGLTVYTGFDVRGTCIGNGSIGGLADSEILYAGPEDLHVINPDGHTRWFNPTEFATVETILGFTMGSLGMPTYNWSATLNGYKYYCDILASDEDEVAFFADPGCPNPRGLFSAGNTNRRTYEIQFPTPGGIPAYEFQYAVVASWEMPENEPPEVPDDFPLVANCQEAYVLSAADMSDLFFVDGTTNGGTLGLQVRVFDHQGAVSPSGVAAEINAIHLETPDNLLPVGGLATFDSTALAGALIGEDAISATYLLEVPACTPDHAGTFPVMIVVENIDPSSYDPGFPGFAFPQGALAAYFSTTVAVGSDTPPTVLSIDPVEGYLDESITDVEVTGLNFINGAEVTLIKNDAPGVMIEADNEVVTGGTTITCDLDLDGGAGAEIGVYNVRVTNPGGLFDELADGFEVLEQTWPYWWENHMYNPSHFGYNPTASSPDPTDWQLMYAASTPQRFKNITPIVAGDKIFHMSYTNYYDGAYSARIYCNNLLTGAPIWNGRVNYSVSSPRINACLGYYKDGTDEYIVAATDAIYCFDANSSGTNPPPLWTYDDTSPVDGMYIGTQMTIYNGKVLAKCQNQATLHIVDVVTGTLDYEVPVSAGGEAGIAAANGKAYVICGPYLDCVNISTGVLEWTANLSGSNVLWVTPCLSETRAYIANYTGYLDCVAIADHDGYLEGDLIWSFNYPGSFTAGGCSRYGSDLFLGTVYSGSRVYAITDNGSSANLKWQSSFTGYFDSTTGVITTPSYPNGLVVQIERYTGIIYFIDITNGNTVHTIGTGDLNYFRAGPAFVDEYMITAGGYNLYVYHVP